MFIFDDELELIEIIEDVLYSIKWGANAEHVLDEMSSDLNDAEYLTTYFLERIEGLKYFEVEIEEAVSKTHEEAAALLQDVLMWAENAQCGKEPDLDSLFRPLHKESAYRHARFYTDFKAKGAVDTAPWVRIYAVKCDDNLYVLTGYGVKLVRKMEEEPNLLDELTKLDIATQYLKRNGFL